MSNKVKILIGLNLVEIPSDDLHQAVVNVDFHGDFLVQICQFNETWAVIDAVNRWGNKCKKDFLGKKVHILEAD